MRPEIPSVAVEQVPAEAVLLDVREDEEWAAGHIAEAIHMPMMSVPQQVTDGQAQFAPETPVVVLCKGGGRSAQVTAWLRQNGYDATNLDGGMLAWQAAARPMVSEGGQPPEVI